MRRNAHSRILATALLVSPAILMAGMSSASAEPSGELIVYTSVVPPNLAPYQKAFNKAYPDIKITWVRDGSGVIAARMIAERDNPHADVVWGVGLPEVVTLDQMGLLQHYAPKGSQALKPVFVDPSNTPPAWTGLDMYLNVICFNTVEAKARNLPVPKTWADLTNPIYKGQITMPSPQATSTGFVYVQTWIQTMGEDKAWDFMKALDKNVAMYTNSSATPCKNASSGEYAVGLSSDITAPAMKTKGAPIDLVVPEAKTGWGIEALALVKGSPHPDLAKLLVDFAASKEAHEVYAQYNGTVGYSGIVSGQANAIANGESMAAKLDIAWGNANRGRILEKWSRLFESKAESHK